MKTPRWRRFAIGAPVNLLEFYFTLSPNNFCFCKAKHGSQTRTSFANCPLLIFFKITNYYLVIIHIFAHY